MAESINKKSDILYQAGNQKTRGIVDLRCFGSGKNIEKIDNRNNIVSEIVKTKKDEVINGKIRSSMDERTSESNNSAPGHFPEKKKNKEINILDLRKFFNKEKISRANECDKELIRNFKKIIDEKKSFEPANKKEKDVKPVFSKEKSLDHEPPKKGNVVRSIANSIFQKSFLFFVIMAFFAASIIFFLSFAQSGIEQKGKVLGASTKALGYLEIAGKSVASSDFENSISSFNSANLNFSSAQKTIDEFGSGFAGVLSDLPINTPLSTAKNISLAGTNISLAGGNVAQFLKGLSQFDKSEFLTSQLKATNKDITVIAAYLRGAVANLENADINYVPQSYREKFVIAQKQLKAIADNFENLSQDMPLLNRMIGSEGHSQKYLLLFENNSEIRASGGFIGSYGIIDIENGEIKNMFIDGIFNPDGQLKEKIVPPMPIQKISASWSMHDANWFADFPISAQKVALFYEKTGGATVDGVIAITPNVIENLLEVAGPIYVPEYGVTINSENFLSMTQLQVEELYDKEENKPKQFLADLAPKIMEKLLENDGLSQEEKIKKYLRLADIMEKILKEKHMILFHRDSDIENMIIERGWGGKVLNSGGDYLNVINSNINGYKTDAVIDQKINFKTEILADGSIIDTVKITRAHNGGESDYNWYNRVNANYMRVYVPLGSELLEAEGHTLEKYEPPIDYSEFKVDPDVQKIEKTIKIHPESGTQVFEESGKTVFGNWVYVSPKEVAEVTYKYRLPYKINFDDFTKPADKYSVLIQKQIGSAKSDFSVSIQLPLNWKNIWHSENMKIKTDNEITIDTELARDMVYGTVFARESSE